MDPRDDIMTDAAVSERLEDDIEADTGSTRRPVGIWWVLLLLVIILGYLSAERRESVGKLAEQIADIVRDFRGYDPEF
jgi:hypothetical protein